MNPLRLVWLILETAVDLGEAPELTEVPEFLGDPPCLTNTSALPVLPLLLALYLGDEVADPGTGVDGVGLIAGLPPLGMDAGFMILRSGLLSLLLESVSDFNTSIAALDASPLSTVATWEALTHLFPDTTISDFSRDASLVLLLLSLLLLALLAAAAAGGGISDMVDNVMQRNLRSVKANFV